MRNRLEKKIMSHCIYVNFRTIFWDSHGLDIIQPPSCPTQRFLVCARTAVKRSIRFYLNLVCALVMTRTRRITIFVGMYSNEAILFEDTSCAHFMMKSLD